MKSKTYVDTAKTIKRAWHLFDIKGKVLGLVSVKIAQKLIGKHKSTYTPHIDNGDYVVVVNANELVLTRNKPQKKVYYKHSGFPGGLKKETFSEQMKKNPAKVVEHSVRGMIPKNKLLDKRMARLKVFADASHAYADKFTVK